MQFSHFASSARSLSASLRLRFRPQWIAALTPLLVVLFLGTPLRAQSDDATLAPWQTFAGMQSGSYVAAPPQQNDRAQRPMGHVPDQPVYEGMGPVAGEEAAPGGCQTCGEEESCTAGCGLRDCPDPFLNRLWFSGEYLMWWDKSGGLPPLGTTSIDGTARADAGILGRTGTSTLIGGQNFDLGLRSGARLSLGCWADACHDEAFEATYLFFGSNKVNYRETSDAYPILARPFYNAQAFRQDAVILAYPNQQTGWLNASVTNQLSSLDLLYRKVMVRGCQGQVDFLAGYRYGRFAENLAVDASTTYTARIGDIPVGTAIGVSDWFAADNEFHGGEVGLSAKNRYCRWTFEVLAKLALGGTRARTRIDGSTTVAVPQQAPVVYGDGMLALPTNSGTSQETVFTAMPELGLNIGYDLTPRLKATFGYTFLYWSRIARPADQIDTSLNPTQFPAGTLAGYPAPAPKFILSDYWAQGFNFGLDYRY